MKRFAILLVLFTVLRPTTASAQVTENDLLGTWRWVQTVGGLAGSTFTPSDTLWVQLQFEPGQVLRGSLSGIPATGSYSLSAPGVSPQVLTIKLDAIPGGLPLPSTSESFFVSIPFPGRLVLDEGCCDRWRHDFDFDAAGLVPVDRPSVSEMKSMWRP